MYTWNGFYQAWFRELPRGILDSLPSEQVMQCESEEDFVKVVRLLPQAEASLLNWTVNLMADIVEFEDVNKMTTRNLALVFAPNMSKVSVLVMLSLLFSNSSLICKTGSVF